jgi:tetratricopeptide (TPR) repeat protein
MKVNISSTFLKRPDEAFTKSELTRRVELLKVKVSRATSNAALYTELGNVLSALDRDDEAGTAYTNAATLLRESARKNPGDLKLQAQLAHSLSKADHADQAEALLRSALKEHPRSWECWLELAEVLNGKLSDELGDAGDSLEQMRRKSRSAAQVEKSNRLAVEVRECIDRASSLAPNEPELALRRAVVLLGTAASKEILDPELATRRTETNAWLAVLSGKEVREAWERAAILNTTNFEVQGMWAMAETAPTLVMAEQTQEDHPLDIMPAARKANYQRAMHTLQSLTESRDSRLAAGAFEALGILYVMVERNVATAETSFRHAVKLDPTRVQPWDGLVLVNSSTDNTNSVISDCKERLKYDDGVLARIFLAKVCVWASRHDEAIKHARQAVTLGPDDPLAHVCFAAALLKQPQNLASMAEIKTHLEAATKLLKSKVPEGQEHLAITCDLDRAIATALSGNLREARSILKELADNPKAEKEDRELATQIDDIVILSW